MKTLVTFLFLLFTANSNAFAQTDICKSLQTAIVAGTPISKLDRYLRVQWKYLMKEFPEWATYVGDNANNDRWTDQSLTAIARRKKEVRCQLASLNKISSQNLTGEDKINFQLAKKNLELSIEGEDLGSEYLVLDQLGGVHQSLADILTAMPNSTLKDYENILARLNSYPDLVAQNEALLREGSKKKITAVKMFLEKVPAQFDALLTARPEDSPYYKPFAQMRGDFKDSEKADLQKRASQALTTKVFPALRQFKDFLVRDYIPQAREGISISSMPNGVRWYTYLVKSHTTTSMNPEELHQLGLSEVARISLGMDEVREKAKFKGDAKAFNKFLMSDSQFYYTSAEDLMRGYRDIAKRADAELPKLFVELPRLTYGIREMPAFKAKDSPTAYYEGGSIDAGRAGYFTANTYDLKARPKWGMEALTLHEAAPGHHLQIARAQELKDLPKFRTEGGYTAYIEGWGLYAESLGEEMGFYQDPYSKYGQLSYEMWRAVRLVVDTGIHYKNWSRQQAIDYMLSKMPKSQLEAEVEIDRYITWPGQALAYKVGQLKFKELRKKATTALGSKFNVRTFHDELLRHGALPIDVLEKVMDDWLKTQTR